MVTSVRLLILACVVSFCSNWQFAYQITYVNTSVKTFYDLADKGYRIGKGCTEYDTECHLPNDEWSAQWSTIVSSFYPGTILGFLAVPLLVERIGVKSTMISMSFSAIAGCIIHFLAAFAVINGSSVFDLTLIVGRFLIGCQSGSSLCLLPLYIMEISPLSVRPFLNTFQQVSQAMGTLIGLLIGSEAIIPLGEYRYTVLQLAAILPTILFVVVLSCTPTTPVQLLKEGAAIRKVVSSLQYYHGELANLKEVENETAAATKTSYSSKPNGIPRATWKGFLIGACAAMSYAFTADDLIDTFSAQILHKSPLTNGTSAGDLIDDSADITSVLMGAILLVASVFGTFLIDRFGRRRLLLFGLIGSAISNAIVVIWSSSTFAATAGFSMTKLFIGLGAGAPAWFLTSELVHPHYMTLMQSLSTGLLLVGTMLGTFFYLRLDLLVGNWALIVLASGPALILAVILYLFLPETKGKTNEEIQHILENNTFSGIAKKSNLVAPVYGSL